MTDSIEMAMYRITELERELKATAEHVALIEKRNAERDMERAATERKQLLTGVTFLGGIIMTLAGVIWSYRSVIFRGQS